MAEWLKALVSKTGIPFTGYRGFESPFFRWISTTSVIIIKHLGFLYAKKLHPKCTGGHPRGRFFALAFVLVT